MKTTEQTEAPQEKLIRYNGMWLSRLAYEYIRRSEKAREAETPEEAHRARFIY